MPYCNVYSRPLGGNVLSEYGYYSSGLMHWSCSPAFQRNKLDKEHISHLTKRRNTSKTRHGWSTPSPRFFDTTDTAGVAFQHFGAGVGGVLARCPYTQVRQITRTKSMPALPALTRWRTRPTRSPANGQQTPRTTCWLLLCVRRKKRG